MHGAMQLAAGGVLPSPCTPAAASAARQLQALLRGMRAPGSAPACAASACLVGLMALACVHRLLLRSAAAVACLAAAFALQRPAARGQGRVQRDACLVGLVERRLDLGQVLLVGGRVPLPPQLRASSASTSTTTRIPPPSIASRPTSRFGSDVGRWTPPPPPVTRAAGAAGAACRGAATAVARACRTGAARRALRAARLAAGAVSRAPAGSAPSRASGSAPPTDRRKSPPAARRDPTIGRRMRPLATLAGVSPPGGKSQGAWPRPHTPRRPAR